MEEGTVRQAAKMYALVAEMEEIKTNVEAMKAENTERASRGERLSWPYSSFQDASEALSKISWKLNNEI